MTDKKEICQMAGYTFASQQSNEESWYASAVSFHEAAAILWQHESSVRMPTILTNAALSIELLLKAIIVARGGVVSNTHKLPALARDAAVTFSDSQKATLELLTEFLIWAGRYPVPKREEAWNHYQDHVFERHVIRERDGNTWRTRANRETFPAIDNYEALWNLAIRKWDEIHSQRVANRG